MRYRKLFFCSALFFLCAQSSLALPSLPIVRQPLPVMYPSEVDLGVDGILINFRMSTEEVLGKTIDVEEAGENLWSLICYNQSGSEKLTLYRHANAPTNSFQEFHVTEYDGENAKKNSKIHCPLSPKHFTSYRGVKLQMTINEVTAIFGDSYRTESKGGEVTVIYAIESNARSTFLQHYKRQSYLGRYHFRTGRLYAYEFGFDRRY